MHLDLKPWDLVSSATPSEFCRWRRKFKQCFLGSDLGVTHIPGQQAAVSEYVDAYIEQHLYNNLSDNTSIFTSEPNEDEIQSCIDFIHYWIIECHPLDTRCMELFKLSQERGESMVQYSNKISDLANDCELNEITQQ